MRIGTSNVRTLCRTGFGELLVIEVTKYNLDTVGMQGVRLSDECRIQKKNYILYYFKGNQDYSFKTGFSFKKCLETAIIKNNQTSIFFLQQLTALLTGAYWIT
jgi:hypothetical protein